MADPSSPDADAPPTDAPAAAHDAAPSSLGDAQAGVKVVLARRDAELVEGGLPLTVLQEAEAAASCEAAACTIAAKLLLWLTSISCVRSKCAAKPSMVLRLRRGQTRQCRAHAARLYEMWYVLLRLM